MVRLEGNRVVGQLLRKLRERCLRRMHELLVRGDLLVVPHLAAWGRQRAVPLALLRKLAESVPILDIAGRENSVTHFRLMLLGLIPVAETPARGTHVFGVVVRVVVE
jgi:hypothetical protein